MKKSHILLFVLSIMMLFAQIGIAQSAQPDIIIQCDDEDAQYYEQCYLNSLSYMNEETQNDPDQYYRTFTELYESLTDEERAEALESGKQVLRYPDETDIPRERARALGYAVLEQHFGVNREDLSYYYNETICLAKQDGTDVWQVLLTRVADAELDRSSYWVHIDPQSEEILDAIKL